MRAGRILCGVAAAALVAVLPASAQNAAVCTFESEVVITPGVAVEPAAGTFTTPSPGSIDCTGTIEGHGTIEYSGHTGPLGHNCAQDVGGGGTLSYTIGSHVVTGTFTFTRAAVTGGFTAETSAGTLNGLFQFEPAEGQDCVNTPITHAHVTGQAVLAGY